MKMNKRGAISFEQIVLFILAIVVLIVVVAFFTGTFEKIRKPIDLGVEEIGKGIECKQLCADAKYSEFCSKNCYVISGVSCDKDGVAQTADTC